ncbi:MAG: hypothetical protein ABI680_03030 [Chthoniobacteraceae bacterium]
MIQSDLRGEILLEGAAMADKPRLYDRISVQWDAQDPKAAGVWLIKQSPRAELKARDEVPP